MVSVSVTDVPLSGLDSEKPPTIGIYHKTKGVVSGYRVSRRLPVDPINEGVKGVGPTTVLLRPRTKVLPPPVVPVSPTVSEVSTRSRPQLLYTNPSSTPFGPEGVIIVSKVTKVIEKGNLIFVVVSFSTIFSMYIKH